MREHICVLLYRVGCAECQILGQMGSILVASSKFSYMYGRHLVKVSIHSLSRIMERAGDVQSKSPQKLIYST